MSTAENIAAAFKDAERVCKKQKFCAGKTAQCIDKLAEALRAAEFDSPDDALCPDGLHERLLNPAERLLKDLTESTKDLHSAVNKLGKVCIPILALGQCTSRLNSI